MRLPRATPSSCCTLLGVGEELRRRAGVDDPAPVEHDDVSGEAAGRRRGSARRAGRSSARQRARAPRRPPSRAAGASPFVGSSTRSSAVLVQERPRDRDHLLLAARERPGSLAAALRAARGTARRRGRSAGRRRARRAGGSPRRSGRRRRRGPPARSRRRGARSRASAARVTSSPSSETVPRERGTSPMSARSVVVLPTPFRPSSAVTPPFGTVERDALQDVRLAEIDVQVRGPRGQRRCVTAAPRGTPSGRSGSAITAAGVSKASSAPWCITAIRWARPTTTSMRCSTMQHRPALLARAPSGSARRAPSTSSADTPAIGSSSRITRGSPASSIASSSLRLSPCESAPAGQRDALRQPDPRRAPTARSSAGVTRGGAPPEPERPAERRLGGEPDVLPHGQQREDARDLERAAEPGAACAGTAARRVTSCAVELDRARRRPDDAREQVEERRLPGPVRADDPDELALARPRARHRRRSWRRRCRARGRGWRGSESRPPPPHALLERR